jgi:hypothetical protein
MQPTLYIHLGQQKTGTSSLQRFCTANRRELIKAFGLLYPTPPDGPEHRHASLFPFMDENWRKVRRETDSTGCKRILVSYEDLSISGIRPEDVHSIRALFPDFAIAYIIYLRRMDESCREWFMQAAKRYQMNTSGYGGYVSWMLKKKSYRLFPSQLLERCVQQVGKENLIIRLYERRRLLKQNIVDDLFSLLDISLPDSMDRSRRYNLGIPEEALPCLTDTLRQYKINDPTRVDIYGKITRAYAWRPGPQPAPDYLDALQKEIDTLDSTYIPGYKALFDKVKPDLALKRGNMTPQQLLIIDLLYSLLFELRKRNTRRFLLLTRLGEWKARFLQTLSRMLPF